jgi:hypothetical protein
MLVLLRPRDRRNFRGGVLWQAFMQIVNESEWGLRWRPLRAIIN